MNIGRSIDLPPPLIWFSGASYYTVLSSQVPASIMKFLDFCISLLLIFHNLFPLMPANSQPITNKFMFKNQLPTSVKYTLVFMCSLSPLPGINARNNKILSQFTFCQILASFIEHVFHMRGHTRSSSFLLLRLNFSFSKFWL